MLKKAGRIIKIRKSWQLNPKTRIKKSKKAYSRKDKKRVIQNEIEARPS
jgi:hypothetical protein